MGEATRLYGRIITTGLHQHEPSLRNLFVSFFAAGGPGAVSVHWARLVFDRIQNPSTFIFNTMIRAYTLASDPSSAIGLYNRMVSSRCPPDTYTFPFLISACTKLPSLDKGIEAHCRAIKIGFGNDIFVQNSLVHLYGAAAELASAHRVFDEMPDRDVATWTTLVTCYANSASIDAARRIFDDMPRRSVVSYSAMIAGYVSNGRFMEALRLFQDMQMGRVEPNDSVLVSVISASANLGFLDTGRWVHSYIRNNNKKKKNENEDMDGRTRTALIDMYSKCGNVDEALRVFSNAKEKPQTAEWTAMITGLAIHGRSEKAVQLFDEMTQSGTTPNAVTFAALLSACSHGGLVGDGLRYFRRMEADFGIKPTVQHVGCVVDLMGRAGLIDVAMAFMVRYRGMANAAMWGALLTACRVHKNVELGVMAAEMLLREEPWNGGVYMTLLSLYGEAGRWGEVERLKKEMKEAGCRKNPGCSMIEVNGTCHEFVSGDSWCPSAWEVCSTILGLSVPIDFDASYAWN